MKLGAPNSTPISEDFEFEALNEALNYRRALFKEFGPCLKGNILEVGAGIGQMTAHLITLAGVERVLALEPDPFFCAKHRALHPEHQLVQGAAADLLADKAEWNAILSINVLEHIRQDQEELALYAALLKPHHGRLCLFVPARQEIYAPIDRDFGHFRRYSKPELREKLQQAGFAVERISYYNLPGYFAWWLNFCLLCKRGFGKGEVRFYDRVIFPTVHLLESKIMRPPIGQSLIAVARAV